jgi:hypothetical protein
MAPYATAKAKARTAAMAMATIAGLRAQAYWLAR